MCRSNAIGALHGGPTFDLGYFLGKIQFIKIWTLIMNGHFKAGFTPAFENLSPIFSPNWIFFFNKFNIWSQLLYFFRDKFLSMQYCISIVYRECIHIKIGWICFYIKCIVIYDSISLKVDFPSFLFFFLYSLGAGVR